jgi:hypothetical protein
MRFKRILANLIEVIQSQIHHLAEAVVELTVSAQAEAVGLVRVKGRKEKMKLLL